MQDAPASQRLVWGAGIALALLIVGLVLARPLLMPAEVPATASAVAENRVSPEAASESEPSQDELARAQPEPPSAPEPTTLESAAAVPLDPPPAASVGQAPSATPSASAARPTQAALATAVRATPIVMFSTSWCPVCQTARDFLRANGLSYSERDIDRDSNAREELKRRSGKSSIPTLEVDGELLSPGFSQTQIMSAVAKSAQRRLGGAKIEIQPVQ